MHVYKSFTVQYIIGELRVSDRNSVCCYHLEDRVIVDICCVSRNNDM